MSFAESAEDIRLEDGHMLVAQLQNEEGEMVEASIDLNSCIGNNDGMYAGPARGLGLTSCRQLRMVRREFQRERPGDLLGD